MSFVNAPMTYIVFTWIIFLLVPLQHAYGMAIPAREYSRTVVLLYNKPAGVVTTHDEVDAKGRINVYHDVLSMRGFVSSSERERTLQQLTGVHPSDWNAVGRLDADTSGLLLLTNDGGLVHHVTNKNSKTSRDLGPLGKTYEAVIMGYYDDTSTLISTVRENGVDIGEKYGGRTEPARDIAVLGHPTRKNNKGLIDDIRGKNRQIRRMFHALGSGVMRLERVAIGTNLTLGDLQEGQWRILSDDEVRNHLKWTPRNIASQRRSSPQRSNSSTSNPLRRSSRD